MKTITCRMLIVLMLCSLTGAASALDALVQKKTFSVPAFTTRAGRILKDVRIGYETYGRLNDRGDNAIFIAHMFLGTSHAAGKYKEDDAEAGYWDAIIGSGKPIDTDKYYVISADTLANTNALDPNVITTGPASINPETGKPYGKSFPMLELRDSVTMHRMLLDSLGVRKVHAVAGWSMGAMQAFDWAATYPDYVRRVIAVGGAAQLDGYAIGWLNAWGRPVMLDPKWQGGDYGPGDGPQAGLAVSLEILVQSVAQFPWVDSVFGRKWAKDGAEPRSFSDRGYLWEDQLGKIAASIAPVLDANSYLLTLRSIANFTVGQGTSLEDGLRRIQAPTLVIGMPTDVVVVESSLKRIVEILGGYGVRAQYAELTGPMGHLDGRFGIDRAGTVIREFLSR
jgi:homoserine O-acetyltransferase